MKKKACIILIISAIFVMCFCQKNFAKYIIQETLKFDVYIDKTPPKINITSNGETKVFVSSNLNEIQKRNNDIKIETSDNIKVQSNQYFYNSSNLNFDNINATEFVSGMTFSEEGFYKIVSTDTSFNKTEIIILIDKSAPEVFVEYFKKGQISQVPYQKIRQVAGFQKHMATQNILEIYEEDNIPSSKNSDVSNEVPNYPAQEIIEIEENIEPTTDTINKSDDETNESENVTQKDEENQANEIEDENNAHEDTKESESWEYCDDFCENEQEIEETDFTDEEYVQGEVIEESSETQELKEEELMNKTVTQVLMAGGESYVGNETEFRNALDYKASVIHVRESINFTSPVYINHEVKIICESSSNALRYGNAGKFIVVQNGGSLTIEGMVIDTNSFNVSGITAISIEAGGTVIFTNGSIVDGGLGNTGILVYDQGTLWLYSCEILRCEIGVNLQITGKLAFGYQEGRSNEFYANKVAFYIDNFYGETSFVGSICMHDNSIYAIYVVNSCGTINICDGTYYNNTHCLHVENVTGGSVNVLGGNYYANGWAICAGRKCEYARWLNSQ